MAQESKLLTATLLRVSPFTIVSFTWGNFGNRAEEVVREQHMFVCCFSLLMVIKNMKTNAIPSNTLKAHLTPHKNAYFSRSRLQNHNHTKHAFNRYDERQAPHAQNTFATKFRNSCGCFKKNTHTARCFACERADRRQPSLAVVLRRLNAHFFMHWRKAQEAERNAPAWPHHALLEPRREQRDERAMNGTRVPFGQGTRTRAARRWKA